MTFEVRRIVDGVVFHRDEDRIIADSWYQAELMLLSGIASGKYDSSCVIYGEIVQVIKIDQNELLRVLSNINRQNFWKN